MNSADIIAGAAVPDNPKLYVIGCFDKRITFYSQQARALSLVHALHEMGHLKECNHIAVIGAGAAGVTAAAALLLATPARVALFENSQSMLSLQSATARRKLDPHIYDWPKIDTTDRAANLPVLDWESGPSRHVRLDVVTQFDQIAGLRPQLDRRLGHKVTNLERVGKFYKLTFNRYAIAGVQVERNGDTEDYDMVLLAVGFGLEPKRIIRGIPDNSYWSEAGVPGAEFEGRASPCFFISGNGDGGLIDFVAAASSDFDHGTMIKIITQHSQMDATRAALQDIDKRARAVSPGDSPLNLWAAYEQEILPLVRGNGLVTQIRMQLRAGVKLVLQTNQPEIFSINTSALNRLAVYVTVKACEEIQADSFQHVRCAAVSLNDGPDPEVFLLDCDGVQISAHEVIVRRGPNRQAVRLPFANIIGPYEAAHKEWLARYGDATLVPTLSKDARAFFVELSRNAGIPPSPRIQRAALYPCRFKMTRIGASIHWTGALAKDDFSQIWSTTTHHELILADGPDELGDVAIALLRVACHCKNLTWYSDTAFWDDLIRSVVVAGPAKGLNRPFFGAVTPAGATEDAHDYPLENLADELHLHLDIWVLSKVDSYIGGFLRDGIEEGTDIALLIAKDLRDLMTVTWSDWMASFRTDPVLLGHFLCLMMSANGVEQPGARVLVGPSRISEIIRGVIVSLAIASSWGAVGPKSALPGNLHRKFDGAPDWSGHAFSSRHINGKITLLNIAEGMWKTEFVILAVEGALNAERSAELSFKENPTGDLAFSEPLGHEPVVLSISPQFCAALELGAAALAELLAKVDSDRFARWSRAIDKRNVA